MFNTWHSWYLILYTWHLSILPLKDFSPDNSAPGFFSRMNGEVFFVVMWIVGSVIVGTLPAVSFILCGTVGDRGGNGYFFFFLFRFRLLLPYFRFARPLLCENRLKQFLQRPGSAPGFGHRSGVGSYFDGRGCRRDGAVIFSFLRFAIFIHLFEYSHENDTCYQEKFQKIFHFASLLNSCPPKVGILSGLS